MLLLAARSERPGFLRPAPADLEELTVALAAKARALGSRPWLLTGAAQGVAVLDAQRITQAMMQLAANAAAHTPAGTAVELGSAVTGGFVEFTVTDHGPGVPAAERLRIFDRFARLDPRRTDGTGLGLSIVAAIAAAHGGRVSVTGRSGGGAAFCLSVPHVRASHPGDIDMNRILIAEDEPHIVRFLVKGLRAQGYATGEAGDGDLALAMARSGQFDLMLLDLGLPGRDGLPRRPAEAGPGRTGLAPSGPGQAGGPGQESRRSALVSLLSVLRSALCRSVCESRPAS